MTVSADMDGYIGNTPENAQNNNLLKTKRIKKEI